MCDKCEDTGSLQGVQNADTGEIRRLSSTMGAGEIRDKYRYPVWFIIGEECPCRQQQRAIAQIAAAHTSIPQDVQNQTLDDFAKLSHAAAALEFARLMINGNVMIDYKNTSKPGVLLTGGTGTGKSSLAFVVYRELSKAGVHGLWVNFMDFLGRYRDTYAEDYHGQSAASLIYPVTRAPFLVLDDVGSETRKSEMAEDAIEIVRQVTEYRYNQHLRTIITTNLEANEKLRAQFGDRVWSRVMGLCHVVKMDGVDMRVGAAVRRVK